MLGRHPQPALRAEEGFERQLAQHHVRGEHHADVVALRDQALLDGLARHLVHLHRHLRVQLLEALQVVRQEVAQHRVAGRDGERALDVLALVRHAHGFVGRRQHRVGMAQKTAPGLGEFHAVRVPLEELLPHQLLELADGGGDGRLRDVQLQRRMRDAPHLGHRREVLELAKGQGHGAVFLGYLRIRAARLGRKPDTARSLPSSVAPNPAACSICFSDTGPPENNAFRPFDC
ncbi:hypothetical protein D9M69_562440 [compost metagenome]